MSTATHAPAPAPAPATVDGLQPAATPPAPTAIIIASELEAVRAAKDPLYAQDLELAGQLLKEHDHDLASFPAARKMPDGTYQDHSGYRSLCLRDRESGAIGDAVSIVRDTYGIVTNRSAALLLATLVRSQDIQPTITVHESNGHANVLMHAIGRTLHGPTGDMGTGLSVQTTHDGSGQLKAGYHINHLKDDGTVDFTANLPLTKWSHRHSKGVNNHIQAGQELLAEAATITASYQSTLAEAANATLDASLADQVLLSAFKTDPLDMGPKEQTRHSALFGAWQASNKTAFALFAIICRHQDRDSAYRGQNRAQSILVGPRAEVKRRALEAVRSCLSKAKAPEASTDTML
jgi:hypothetical protein